MGDLSPLWQRRSEREKRIKQGKVADRKSLFETLFAGGHRKGAEGLTRKGAKKVLVKWRSPKHFPKCFPEHFSWHSFLVRLWQILKKWPPGQKWWSCSSEMVMILKEELCETHSVDPPLLRLAV